MTVEHLKDTNPQYSSVTVMFPAVFTTETPTCKGNTCNSIMATDLLEDAQLGEGSGDVQLDQLQAGLPV